MSEDVLCAEEVEQCAKAMPCSQASRLRSTGGMMAICEDCDHRYSSGTCPECGGYPKGRRTSLCVTSIILSLMGLGLLWPW